MECSVTVVHNHWLKLSDGIRLASRLWLPFPVSQIQGLYPPEEDIQQLCMGEKVVQTVPTVLEILPYFKDIYTLERDFARHTLFAQRGYAVCRVEMRGTGSSDGFYYDEYTDQEMRDTEEVLEHLGTSPWSNRHVAMYGKSWGGFNGVQMAARNPKYLSTAISLYSTDDRFNNDVHYLGGCVVGDGMVNWSTTMHCWNARPPNPKYCPDWKEKWLERLEKSSEPWLLKWLNRQDGNLSYWKQGSIKHAHKDVKIPILIIGGLFDGYTDGAFRMISGFGPESRAIIGPWGHNWPDVSLPGPQIDFVNLCDKWFSAHMRGVTEGMNLWPRFQVYIRDEHGPATQRVYLNGNWTAVDEFSDTSDGMNFYLGVTRRLIKKPTDRGDPVVLKGHFLQGLFGGQWMSWGDGEGLPGDQRVANGVSECWRSDRLFDITVCGYIQFTAKVKGSGCVGARLSCENDDGSATLISYGVQAVNNTDWDWVVIRFKPTTYKLNPGSRLILALSPSLFPLIVNPKLDGSVSVDICTAKLNIQTLTNVSQDQVHFDPPKNDLYRINKIIHSNGNIEEQSTIDIYTKKCSQKKITKGGITEFPDFGLRMSEDTLDLFKANIDMTEVAVTAERSANVAINGANARIEAVATMTHMGTYFDVRQGLKVFLDGEVFFERSWKNEVKNNLLQLILLQ